MRKAHLAFLILCGALLAGCGGDDKPDPPTAQEEVKTAATRVLRTEDARLVCNRLVTQVFIDEVFEGDRQACIDAEGESRAEDEDDGTQTVTDVKVTGSKALVNVRTTGGKADGLTGHVTFARQAGAWKLDRFEDDYLRDTLVTSMRVAGEQGGNGVFTEPSLRDCMIADTQALPSEKLRDYVYLFIRRDEAAATDAANAQAARCPDELATYVTNAIIDALQEGGERSPAFERCARRKMRFLLTATGLGKEALKGSVTSAGKSALQGLALGVAQACKGK